jgi:hypothetical protein
MPLGESERHRLPQTQTEAPDQTTSLGVINEKPSSAPWQLFNILRSGQIAPVEDLVSEMFPSLDFAMARKKLARLVYVVNNMILSDQPDKVESILEQRKIRGAPRTIAYVLKNHSRAKALDVEPELTADSRPPSPTSTEKLGQPSSFGVIYERPVTQQQRLINILSNSVQVVSVKDLISELYSGVDSYVTRKRLTKLVYDINSLSSDRPGKIKGVRDEAKRNTRGSHRVMGYVLMDPTTDTQQEFSSPFSREIKVESIDKGLDGLAFEAEEFLHDGLETEVADYDSDVDTQETSRDQGKQSYHRGHIRKKQSPHIQEHASRKLSPAELITGIDPILTQRVNNIQVLAGLLLHAIGTQEEQRELVRAFVLTRSEPTRRVASYTLGVDATEQLKLDELESKCKTKPNAAIYMLQNLTSNLLESFTPERIQQLNAEIENIIAVSQHGDND